MNASTLGLLAVLAAQSAEFPKFVVPNVSDLTIKTRQTIDRLNSSIRTEIIYLKGARQRRETIVEWPWLAQRTHMGTTIMQCDERRELLLNDEAKTYAYVPVEDMSEHQNRLRLTAKRSPQPEARTGGDVTITVDSVDTGHRRQVGRYIARRVITTTRTEPGSGVTVRASERRQDGWYIDLPPANCWNWGDHPPDVIAYAHPANAPRDRVHVEQLGTARRGYPIEETARDNTEASMTTTKLELLEFSDAPLDAVLFTVPPGYRPALPRWTGEYDLTKPDTLTNRLQSYWEVVYVWANYFFR